MNYEEGLKTIRREFPDGLLWFSYEYKGLLIFAVSMNSKFTKYDYTIEHYAVTKHGVIYFDSDKAIEEDRDNYLEVLKNVKCIDITEAQLAMTRP